MIDDMNTEKKRELTPTGPSAAEVPASPIYASIVPVTFLEWGSRTEDGETQMCLVWAPQAPAERTAPAGPTGKRSEYLKTL